MKSLNFLFVEDKQSLQRAYQALRFQHTALLLLLTVFLFTFIVWGTNQLLRLRVQQLDEEIASKQQTELVQRTNAAEEKVREFNSLVKVIDEESKKQFPLSSRVSAITSLIPEGIQIDQLSIAMNARQLTLGGSAANRDSYLALRDSLIGSEWFDSVELPITDLLSRENIRFTLQTQLTDSFFQLDQ